MPLDTPAPSHYEHVAAAENSSAGEVAQTFPMPMEARMLGIEPAVLGIFEKDLYKSLRGPTPEERQAISDMMTTLANTSLIFLWGKQSYLRKKGEETKGLNTLKFLEVILTDTNPDPKKNLRKCMQEIRTSHLKWNGFVNGQHAGDGIGGALDRMADSGELNPYLPGFYNAVGIDPAVAQPYVEKRDWSGWLDVLMGKPANSNDLHPRAR